MRNIGDPALPSRKEVEEHFLTHVPYRNWCPHCVRDLDHRKAVEEENRRIREFSFDCCFLGDKKGPRITVLVRRERVTGMTIASVVPVKGTSGQFAAMKVLDIIKECGAAESEFILKTDQEPAIDVDHGFCYTVNRPCLDCRLLTFRLEGPLSVSSQT